MKGCIIEANIGGQGRGWLPISLYTLYCDFKIIPFNFTLMFRMRYYKMVQSLYKKLTPGLKNHMSNLHNYRQAVESPKSWNLIGYFCPKNAFLQLSIPLYRGFIQHYFQLLAWKFTNDLSHFWNHFSRHDPYIYQVKMFRLATARIKID